MKYQLVLQWPASSLKGYGELIEIERVLLENLTGDHEIDGHDAGSGEMNIFIQTDNPQGAFKEIKWILGSRDFWVDARIAYREMMGSNYTVLWPPGLTVFRVS